MRSMLAALAITTAMAALTAVAAEPEGKLARVGRVYTGAPSTTPRGFATFTERLRELGWTEGRNLVIESRWAEGRDERFPALIRELVERKVDVIVVTGTAAALAAKQTTGTIPIVVAGMGDPWRAVWCRRLRVQAATSPDFPCRTPRGCPGNGWNCSKRACRAWPT